VGQHRHDFALGCSFAHAHDHLLRSLTPLYAGWLAYFVLQMKSATAEQIDERVEQVCRGLNRRNAT
jgi:hypothetical protein